MEVYLDNSATTRCFPEAAELMKQIMCEDYGNPSSLHRKGVQAENHLRTAKETIAKILKVNEKELLFTSGGTESDNLALIGAAHANCRRGKHLITTSIEHPAILQTMKYLEEEGYRVTYLPVDEKGCIRLEDLQRAITGETILVSIMYTNNEVGSQQPIAQAGALIKKMNPQILFHVDAVQAVGTLPIDVKAMNIDMLSMSAHKFYGPKGVGALYARKGIRLQPFMHGGAQENKHRAGTENVPGIVGMGKAIELAEAEREANAQRLQAMRDRLIAGIEEKIPYARLNGSRTQRLPGHVNFSFQFIEGESLLMLLDFCGICASSGSACTSGSLDPSHVLLAIGLPHEIAHGSLRLTLGRDTTLEDVDFAVDSLKATLQNLRMMSPLYEDFQQGKVESVIERFKADGFPYAN